MTKKSSFKAVVTFVIALIFLLIFKNPYYLGVLIFLGINLLITIGLSLLMGYAGQISLGQAAFFGIGAYTSGVLTAKFGLPIGVSFLASIALTVFIAFIIGIPTLKLKGHYLAMATLGLGEIVYIVFNELIPLTGGPSGFGEIPVIKIFSISLDSDPKFYIFIWAIVSFIVFISLNIVNSRIGRALKALNKNEEISSTLGINTSKVKLVIFTLSAGYAALAGFLYAHYVTFLSPGSFSLNFSILLVTMVAIGGMENIWGAFLGTAILTLLPEYLRFFKDFDILIYGAILMSIMLLRPEGLYGIKIKIPFSKKTKKEI